MRKYLAVLLVLAVLAFGTAAWADEQLVLGCLDMPYCCQISCVKIDVNCCGYGCNNGPLRAEFLNMKGEILGTAVFSCNWCNEESVASLDKPVNASDVCSVRLVKPNNDCQSVTWASLKVFCGTECGGKWKKVFKGDLWCWEPVPAPKPAPVVEDTPPPAPPAEAPPAVEPEPKPDFSSFPEPTPEPEPEVILVPGNG
jgi:hypothetical protein